MAAHAIVLLGPPGSGKGTQAERLRDELGFTPLATGDLLREARDEGTELGEQAAEYMDRGDLVPDELIVGLLDEQLAQLHGEPVLFDGFPRTVGQADALADALKERDRELDAVVLVAVPDDVVSERISGRGEGRDDDDPETVRERLKRLPRGDRAARALLRRARAAAQGRRRARRRSGPRRHPRRARLTTIDLFAVPPGEDEQFLADWRESGAAGVLYRALRDDVDFRFAAVGEGGGYEVVREDGAPGTEGGCVLIEPFDVAPDDDERFLAAWAARREGLADKRGSLGTRLHRDREAGFRFVEVAHWSSPLMVFRAAAAALAFPSHPALYQPRHVE